MAMSRVRGDGSLPEPEPGHTSVLFSRSKFLPPRAPFGSVRPAAADAIAEALERVPFVLLCAPAGSGKTTAMAAWAEHPGRFRPVWLRLDPHDDDVHTLASALSTALRACLGRAGRRLDEVLSSSLSGELHHLATAFVNDLDEIGDIVLVVDDLQHLPDGAAVGMLERVLDTLGPSNRLLVASRVEPPWSLARRMVRREVVELGMADLRLDQRQLELMLSDVGASASAMARRILERTDGWAAAAVLMVSRFRSDPSSGGHDGGEAMRGDQVVDEFLREEVLDLLPLELRNFVLETSLLDELTPDACWAVTGVDDTGRSIAEVERRGLLLFDSDVQSGTSAPIARYHDRIAEFLRRQLSAEVSTDRLKELHVRAASVSSSGRAVDLLLAVGATDEAAQLVCEFGRSTLTQPGLRLPRGWLAAFDEAAVRSVPWLELLVGLAEVEDGAIPESRERLTHALESMRAAGDQLGVVHAAQALAEVHLASGELDDAIRLLDELLALPTTADQRIKTLVGRMWFDYFAMNWVGIEALLSEAFNLSLGSASELGQASLACGLGTEFLFVDSGPTWVSDRCRELDRRVQHDVVAKATLDLMQAAALLLGGQLSAASEIVAAIDDRALELGGLGWLAVAVDRVKIALSLAAEDHAAIDDLLSQVRPLLVGSERHHQERAMYAYALARSGWIQHDAERVRQGLLLLGEVTPNDRPEASVTAAVLSAMVQRHEGFPDRAVNTLEQVRELHRSLRFCLATGTVELELAAALLEAGRTDAALEVARAALTALARVDGIGLVLQDGPLTHRPVLELCATSGGADDFARRVLERPTVGAHDEGIPVPGTGERLTAREAEVLAHVVAGDSNRAIGEALYIGERTVKSHMTAVMRKLAVSSRSQAAARARELGIG